MATTITNKVVYQADVIQITQAQKQIESGNKRLSDSFAGLKSAIGGIALTALISNAVKMAATVNDLAQATGFATETILGFRSAITTSGGSLEAATKGFEKFSQSIKDARDGSIRSQEGFLQLGVTIDDLKNLSDTELFKKTIQGLADMGAGAEATALKMQLFGKSAASIDFVSVNKGLDAAIGAEARYASAIESAGKANDTLSAALVDFQEALLKGLQPLFDMISSMGKMSEATKDFIAQLVKIAGYLAIFIPLGRAIKVLYNIVKPIVGLFALWAGKTGAVAAEGLLLQEALQKIALAASRALGSFTGVVQILQSWKAVVAGAIAGLAVLNQKLIENSETWRAITDFIFGFVDAVIKAGKYIVNLVLGIEDVEAAATGAAKALEKQKKQQKEVTDIAGKFASEIQSQTQAYKDQVKATLDRIGLETRLIGLSEERQAVERAVFDANKRFHDDIAKLEARRAAEETKKGEIAKANIQSINAEIKARKEVHNEEIEGLKKAIPLNIQRNETYKQTLLHLNAEFATRQRIIDLQNQAGAVGLSQIEQANRRIAEAANARAEAEIFALEVSRGGAENVTAEERNRIREKAIELVKEEQAANEGLIKAQSAQRQQEQALERQVELNQKIQDIYDEQANSTLPSIQRQLNQIDKEAQLAAIRRIEAEKKIQGVKRLTLEEEKRIFQQEAEAAERLKNATRESYEHARRFSTGWAKAMNEYIENATNAARVAENVFNKAFKGMEDALVNFAKTGKFEWKQFLAILLEELLRAQIQALFAKLIQSLSDSLGGVTDGLGGGNAFAPSGGNLLSQIGGLLGGGGGGGGTGGIAGAAATLGNIFGGASPSTPVGGGIGGAIGQGVGGGGGLGQVAQSIGKGFGNVVEGIGSGLRSVGSSIADGIGSLFGGGGSSAPSWANDLDFFAHGGTLGAGKLGIVGERGPELIQGPATITPLNGGLGGSMNVTYNINAVDARSFKELVARDPSFIHAVAMQGAKTSPPGRR